MGRIECFWLLPGTKPRLKPALNKKDTLQEAQRWVASELFESVEPESSAHCSVTLSIVRTFPHGLKVAVSSGWRNRLLC